ncbi:TetR family transcriptional regulator [Leptobacterium flavescens]|uniref:TetR family transcriptional regulator n=1 Tax=Leptobacterium flavescens TaxID=472055 RepID=A0A6P0UNX4_9FLAO|nr:TetR/AcrR family transcriptional regulator [Leptobacterium flavescens]NER14865.1 TetR family transcriptional regulator [Leptobacterium flavescens]
MKTQVKENILNIGVRLITQKGYNNVGIQEVLNEAHIPKGSFYHYFKSKEDFGLQVISHYNKSALVHLQSYFEDKSRSPRERMLLFFEDMKAFYTSKEYSEGCLLGNCSIELSDNSDVLRLAIAKELNQWHSVFENCIAEAQEAGEIKSDKKASDIADFILNSWEGALLRMKAIKTVQPLEVFVDFLRSYII